MAVLLISADLATSSRVAGAAAQRGLQTTTVMDSASLAVPPESPISLAIIDLGMPRLDVRNVVNAMRAWPEPPGVILAFGPHVHEQLLAAAKEAGCDTVLARGQFYARLDEFMKAAQQPE